MELTCIKCGEKTEIQLNLTDGDTLYCPECEQDFTLAEVEAAASNWQRVIAWAKLCPARQAAPPEPTGDASVERILKSLRGG